MGSLPFAQDTSPVYISQSREDDHQLLGYIPHVHIFETGKCIKNRYGRKCGEYNDIFTDIRSMHPNHQQEAFINAFSEMINIWLKMSGWGKRSGKTTARLMLAKAIIDRDN